MSGFDAQREGYPIFLVREWPFNVPFWQSTERRRATRLVAIITVELSRFASRLCFASALASPPSKVSALACAIV